MGVCKVRDEFVGDLYWIAYLSNGEKIYRDDGREEELERSAWIRLREYVTENNLYIERLTIHFRSNWAEMYHPEADGYYFSNGVAAWMGSGSVECFVLGYVKNGIIYKYWYLTPELIIIKEEEQPQDQAELCLILKNTHQNTLLTHT